MKILIKWNRAECVDPEEYEIKDWDVYDDYIMLRYENAPEMYIPFTSMQWWKIIE